MEPLGFSPGAEAVYRALLRDSSLRDEQIAEQLVTDEDIVRRSRDELMVSGLITPSLDSDGVVCVHPQVLEERIRRQQASLDRNRAQLSEARLQLDDLIEEYLEVTSAPRTPGETVELVGHDTIQAELARWGSAVREEVLAVHPQRTFRPEQIASAEVLDVKALSRGVRMLSIFHEASRRDPAVAQYHSLVRRHGGEVRYLAQPPARMILFDREVGFIPMHSVDTGRAALVVRGEALASMLRLTFDLMWSRAHEGEGAVPGPEEEAGPSDRDRLLLQLMSAGYKDEAAARHMGVSVRTLRRQVADLMVRLEAGSRFEAGMRAAARGWLHDHPTV